jgi:hypothetical protein
MTFDRCLVSRPRQRACHDKRSCCTSLSKRFSHVFNSFIHLPSRCNRVSLTDANEGQLLRQGIGIILFDASHFYISGVASRPPMSNIHFRGKQELLDCRRFLGFQVELTIFLKFFSISLWLCFIYFFNLQYPPKLFVHRPFSTNLISDQS